MLGHWCAGCCSQHLLSSRPDCLCNIASAAAAGKGDFILGIFQSADLSNLSQTALPGDCSGFQRPLADRLRAVRDLSAAICISPNLDASPTPHVSHVLCHCPRAVLGQWQRHSCAKPAGCRPQGFPCCCCPELLALGCVCTKGVEVEWAVGLLSLCLHKGSKSKKIINKKQVTMKIWADLESPLLNETCCSPSLVSKTHFCSPHRAFFLALFKHLMFLEKRGCPRTALEFCKLILR